MYFRSFFVRNSPASCKHNPTVPFFSVSRLPARCLLCRYRNSRCCRFTCPFRNFIFIPWNRALQVEQRMPSERILSFVVLEKSCGGDNLKPANIFSSCCNCTRCSAAASMITLNGCFSQRASERTSSQASKQASGLRAACVPRRRQQHFLQTNFFNITHVVVGLKQKRQCASFTETILPDKCW